MLPTLTAIFPFAIVVGQLGLGVCRWWAVYVVAAAVAITMSIGTFAMCKAGGPRLTVGYPWAIYWLGLAALTAVQGFFYTEFRNQCPVRGPIIPIDMLLEWLIAPIVLMVVMVSAFRYSREHRDN